MRRFLLSLFCCCLPLSLQGYAQGRSTLPPAVSKALAAAGIPQSAVGVVVQEVGASSPRLAVNAQQAMNPASVMKLVTTSAALETLGPAYTWKTGLLTAAPLNDGVLAGDLYLRGSGDPKFTAERLWLLLRQLRNRGVKDIEGNLVLDRSAFAPVDAGTAFDDQPLRPYNVIPDALLLNFKAVRLTLSPDPARKVVAVLPELLPDNLDVVVLIKLGNNGCGDWKDALRADLTARDNRYRLVLTGTYSASCGEKIWNLGLLPHDQYVLGLFRQIWHELGGELRDGVKNGVVPPDARLLAETESPTLAEVIRDINKYSNNVMARQLFLSLAPQPGATTEGAAAAVLAWLAGKGLNFPELVLDNGSGLSRKERIAPINLARLLQKDWESPLMPEFVASLPLTAVDGTMKKRLGSVAVAGHGHIKTGTLEGVKTIAGYVQDAAGRTVIVVFLVNHPNAAQAQAAQDALLQWAYER
ncbi:MAG: D-alanyl-D-alanine carboxypeptidase/D-alanyl-D-alanine-endopeptidase [Rhodocyclaceae bacterium]|nr:MAG: D-alanyl-D-alanine carboxypeptidase/D-alanyl-D-alanine-endopeptidase [Rhodocyclaceae bacterium]